MAIADVLESLGARVPTRQLSVDYKLYRPTDAPADWVAAASPARGDGPPLVSCLMVTKGDRFTIKYALACYQAQTHRRRELVVVVDRIGAGFVEGLLRAAGIDSARVFVGRGGQTLGELRNLAIEHARGDILIQWDDDDLCDPLRIKACVDILTRLPAVAVLQARLLLWWPARALAAISGRRFWEGTIAVWRDHAPTYPSLGRGEDTPGVQQIAHSQQVALADAPLLYVYAITQANTWHREHFDGLFSAAERRIEGDDYRALVALLGRRLPIEAYEREARELAQP
jgi:glycosyltransferase involved in cell wall biosynthesis